MIPNIIHLIDRIERLERIEKDLPAQGITGWKLWDGVLGYTPNSVNISKAHKQIVQWAKDNNLPEVLIFEDDIRFHAVDSFQYYLSKKPEDFDLYLGGVYRGEIKDDGTVERFTGMHHYIIKQKFYDTFLAVNEKMDIDHALAGLGKYVVCYPFSSTQYNGWSDNVRQETNYDLLLQPYKIYGKQ